MSKDLEKLKNFLLYLGVNAIVECENFETGPADNGYLFPQKIITLRKDLDLEQKIITLAHEGGHVINRLKHEFWNQLSAEAIDILREIPSKVKIYFNFEDEGLLMQKRSLLAQEIILEEEKLAWVEAELMLKQLGIKRPRNWNKHKKVSLRTYEVSLETARKYKKSIFVDMDRN